jgi:hypothetical protein
MSNKKIWATIISALLIGVIFMGIGLTLGAKKHIYFDFNGLHIIDTNSNNKEYVKETNLEKFSNVELDITSENVEFITADSYGIEIIKDNNIEFFWENKNDTLTVKQKNNRFFNIFNINIDFWHFGKGDVIRIYLPKDAIMDNVNLTVSSGRTSTNDLNCKNLSIKTTSGSNELTNSRIENLEFVATSGKIEINNCEILKSDIKLTTGKIDADNVKLTDTNIYATSGKIDISGELFKKTKIKIVSGNANFDINGRPDDYSVKSSVTSGYVQFDGEKLSNSFINRQAENEIDIVVTSGYAKLDFNN